MWDIYFKRHIVYVGSPIMVKNCRSIKRLVINITMNGNYENM